MGGSLLISSHPFSPLEAPSPILEERAGYFLVPCGGSRSGEDGDLSIGHSLGNFLYAWRSCHPRALLRLSLSWPLQGHMCPPCLSPCTTVYAWKRSLTGVTFLPRSTSADLLRKAIGLPLWTGQPPKHFISAPAPACILSPPASPHESFRQGFPSGSTTPLALSNSTFPVRKPTQFEECGQKLSWVLNASAELLVILYSFGHTSREKRDLCSSHHLPLKSLTCIYCFLGIVPVTFS